MRMKTLVCNSLETIEQEFGNKLKYGNKVSIMYIIIFAQNLKYELDLKSLENRLKPVIK